MFLTTMVQKEPGVIVGPISLVLGYIVDFIFKIVSFFTLGNSFGVTIILFTIVIRFLMLPLAFKQQKSMSAMQRIAPEVDAIKKKYGDNKDPELQQKMNAEIQKLYSTHKINPLGGCLPMLIQMPIFISLNYLIQHAYSYVGKIGAIYDQLAQKILSVESLWILKGTVTDPESAFFGQSILDAESGIFALAQLHIPKNMTLNLLDPKDLMRVLNKFSQADWSSLVTLVPAEVQQSLSVLLMEKEKIEFFLGINLASISGMAFPGIMVPILAAASTFLSSWIMNKQQKTTDDKAKTQQKVMLYAMPLMMGFFSINMSAGVGIYWTISSFFQVFQQLLLNTYYLKKDETKSESEDKDGKPGGGTADGASRYRFKWNWPVKKK